ncbi:MAG: hypothetical protein NTY36_05140 [Deltaproteobacteria bacterium]|nr:hypothetical protein [Deltaproteobacteria bacterium]
MNNLTFRRSCSFGLALSALIVLCAGPVYAQWRPKPPISVPGATETHINSINNMGTMVGTAFFGATAQGLVIDPNGAITMVNFPGATGTFLQGVNDAGNISGFYTDSVGGTHGFIEIGGVFGTHDFPGATSTQLFGLSNTGQAAATFIGSGVTHSAVYNSTTATWTIIKVPTGTTSSEARGISVDTNLNLACGYYTDGNGVTHGYLYNIKTAGFTTFDHPLATGGSTQLFGVNGNGYAVGAYLDFNLTPPHWFVMAPSRNLDITPPPNADSFNLIAMNDQKTLVGTMTDALGAVTGLEELYSYPIGNILNNLLD